VTSNSLSFGNEGLWAHVGLVGTGALFFLTWDYARHAVHSAYLSADNNKLSFVMHNMIGSPGRVLVANVNEVHKLTPMNIFASNLLPVRIQSMNKNIVLDPNGKYYEEDKLLLKLLDQGKNVSANNVVSKEQRVNWQKESYWKNKAKR